MAKRRTKLSDDLTVMEGEGYKAVVNYTGSYESRSLDEKDEATKVKSHSSDGEVGDIVYWGAGNDYPQKVLEAISKNGAAEQALDLRVRSHYGNGLVFFNEDFADGKKDIKLIGKNSLPTDLKSFFKSSQLKKFWKEVITDLESLSIAFPEYILSNDYKKITKLKRQQAAHCRFEQMSDEGAIGHVFISTKWKDGVSLDDEKYVGKTPYIDPYMSVDEVKEYCKKHKIRKFIRPTLRPLKDTSYYPTTGWHAVYKNGWVEVTSLVADLKKNMFKNQSVIVYHIEVAIDYFENKYKEKWHDLSAKEQDEKRTELLDALDERLSDTENTHKSLMTIKYKDDAGQYVDGVTITAIDNKIKDGAYLPEASAGNSEILFAFGVDPTLIGHGVPGGKMGGGGGSDKREAFIILNALMKSPRETTLEIWEFLQEYNGWDENLMAGFENTVLTTLDKNPTGQVNTTQA